MSNLQQRILTGIAGALIIGFGLLYNQYTYLATNFGVALIGLDEFYRLCKLAGYRVNYWLAMSMAVVLNTASYLAMTQEMNPVLFSVGFPLVLLMFLDKLLDKEERDPMMSLGLTFLGLIYVVLPFAMVHGVAIHAGQAELLGIIMLIWGNDIGAYFAGRYLGKRKLFERISPNKTWEGYWGGALVALAASFAWPYLFDDLNATQWIVMGIMVPPVATIGDLVESMIKRSLKVKDSGGFMPGHGGILDRLDSLLFVFPVATALVLIWFTLKWL